MDVRGQKMSCVTGARLQQRFAQRSGCALGRSTDHVENAHLLSLDLNIHSGGKKNSFCVYNVCACVYIMRH